MNKVIVLSTLVGVSGCTDGHLLQINPTRNSTFYSVCEQYEKPDKTEHVRCNGHKILNFSMKF